MTTNEQLHGDIAAVKLQIEELLSVVLAVEDHGKRLKILEQWRKEAEAFQSESRQDRKELRKMVGDVDRKLGELQALSTPIIETWEGVQFINKALKAIGGVLLLASSISAAIYFWVGVAS